MEEHYPCPKMTVKQWIANFWYYYKWLFIVSVIFIIFIGVCTVQYFSKIDPDVELLYVGSHRVSDQACDQITSYAKEFTKDVNGDGKSTAHIKTIHLIAEFDLLDQGEQIKAMQKYQSYSDEILGGDASVLLLDPYFYDELSQAGALINLYGVFGTLPENATDYYGIPLSKTILYAKEGFSTLPPETMVCLKFSGPVTSLSDEEKFDIDYENIAFFRSFLEGKESE